MSKAKRSKSGDESKGLEGLTDALVHRIPTAILMIVAVAILIVIGLAIVKPQPVKAQERCAGRWQTYCSQYGNCYDRCIRSGPRVYGYERRWDEDERSGRHCRDVRKAVGDQHLTVDGAKKAANEAWAATVRFHIGEKFLDLNNARRLVYTCSRSSIKEGGVTTGFQTLTRCELEAQPCAPLPEHERREER